MSSLKERIELLESDLKAVPSRISVYHDLPFAILRYDPTDEWELRREVKLLATRLEGTGRKSTSSRCRNSSGGRSRRPRDWRPSSNWRGSGATTPPRTGHDLPSDRDWRRWRGLLAERLHQSRPSEVGGLPDPGGGDGAGDLPHVEAARQDAGQDRVTTILFYPGSIEGTTGLRFMDLKDRDALGNYRVKIYG